MSNGANIVAADDSRWSLFEVISRVNAMER
jgi:hypothetical protein